MQAQDRGIMVTSITVLVMMIVSFLCSVLLGAKLVWCLMLPWVTALNFYFIFLYMMKYRGWGKRKNKKKMIFGLPVGLVIFYFFVVFKASAVRIWIGGNSDPTIVELFPISMFVNVLGSPFAWFLGIKEWLKNYDLDWPMEKKSKEEIKTMLEKAWKDFFKKEGG